MDQNQNNQGFNPNQQGFNPNGQGPNNQQGYNGQPNFNQQGFNGQPNFNQQGFNGQQNFNQQNYRQPYPRQPVFYGSELNRPLLKSESKAIMKGNYGNTLLAYFIPSLITSLIALIPHAGSVISWLCGPCLTVGGVYLTLLIVRYNQGQIGDIFKPFNNFGNIFGATFTTQLFTALWSLLLVIPGIYKAFCWILVPYILADNPNMTGTQARDLSNRMMDGHKWEYFCLCFSFIGWMLLSALTFGILMFFYVGPWMQATIADYYDNLKMKFEADQQAYQQTGWNQGSTQA